MQIIFEFGIMRATYRYLFFMKKLVIIFSLLSLSGCAQSQPAEENSVVESYSMVMLSEIKDLKKDEPIEIIYKISDLKGEAVKNFEVSHEKLMHLIVAKHDLSEFQHIHPELDEKSGEFKIAATFDSEGLYRLYSDFQVEGENYTLFEDLNIGDLKNYEPKELALSLENEKIGDYEVAYKIAPEIHTGSAIEYKLDVTRDGLMVEEFEDYLGAKGHSVILREETLDFIHTHPKDDGLLFETSFDKPGKYRIFTQFNPGEELLTSTYTIEVLQGNEETMEMEHSVH